MRQIEIYYDVDNDVLKDADGNQINSQLYPFIYFEEQAVAQVQLLNGDNTDYTKLTGTYSISATVDDDFDADDDAYCKTLNANINVAGDWKSGGNADIAQGEISIRLDADNTNYESKIGSNKKKNAFLEIQIRDSGDTSLVAVFEFPFEARNLRDISGTPAPSPASNYYTKTEADALLLDKCNIMTGGVTGNIVTVASDDDVQDSGTSLTSLVGGMKYQGTWNANTNTPTLSSGSGTQGYYYVVSVAGSTNLDGITDWQINDWAVYNGTAWEKIDNTDSVTASSTTTFTNKSFGDEVNMSDNLVFSDQGGAVSAPHNINMGNGFADTTAPSKAKLLLYEGAGIYIGLGVTSNSLDFFSNTAGGGFSFYPNGVSSPYFTIESDGTLSVASSLNYETLVTADDDIPNKKYVDDNSIDPATFTQSASYLRGTGSGTYEEQKNNFSGTTAPTSTDDSGSGYSVGSRWIDTTNDKEYVCLDATATSAVWTETTAGATGGEANTASNLGAGVGVYETKSGVDLQFNSLVGANGVSVSEDDPNNEIDIQLDINGMTEDTAPSQSDELAVYNGSANRKMTIGNLRQDINNDQTGTTYTLVLTDAGKSVWMNNASANTLTIPTNASVAFPVNTTIVVVQEGAGTTSIAGDTGVTLNGVSAGSGDVDGQYKAVSLIKRATDTWIAIGGIGTVA